MEKNKKILSLAIIVTSVIATCLLIYYLVPYNQEPAGLQEKTEVPQEETLKKVTWNEYTNSSLGFSMKIPSEVNGLYKCPSKTNVQVPVKTFENNENGVVYISQEYYYKAEKDSESKEFTGPCEKNNYSLTLLEKENEESYSGKPFLGWAVFVKDAKDEDALGSFIKNH
ncbi:MAG: hypothetical protein GF370_02860, partial [Candidatus Nealsonbacteria bacterium]|nr:hypothetical protein [Candidatus Nealsonbacteria bacterium]